MLKHITSETEIKETTGVTLVKFSVKTGCRFCTEFEPKYEQFALQNPEINCFIVEKDTLQIPASPIEKKYNVSSFPTILSFQNGVFQGQVQKYQFMTNREIEGYLLDQQKALYEKKVFVEDLTLHVQARIAQQNAPVDPLDAPLPEPLSKEKEDCTNCEA